MKTLAETFMARGISARPVTNRSSSMLAKESVLVSVVMPVYNGEQYVVEAIESIMVQSCQGFELILINDGSTDKTLSILKEYANRDGRISLITRENKGLIASLNEGIDCANGKWIVRMDADDIALPNRIERLLYWIEKSGADVAGSWVKFFGSYDRRIWKGYQSDQAIKAELLFKCPFVHPAVIMRTALAKQLKYDPTSEKAEDYDLWVRAASNGWKMTNVPEILLRYRRHASQVSVISSDKQRCTSEAIRKKYWQSMNFDMNAAAVQEAFRLTSFFPASIDLDLAEPVLLDILSNSQGEARGVIIDNIARAYMKIAYDHPGIGKRWVNICRKYGVNVSLKTKFMMGIAQYFRIQYQSYWYLFLKKIYSFFVR